MNELNWFAINLALATFVGTCYVICGFLGLYTYKLLSK